MLNRAGKIAFRMDDVGASTKQFEVYSKSLIGNYLILKYFPPFKAWAPYEEISPDAWKKIIDLLIKEKVGITVAVTASWVDQNCNLIPFPEKFPDQARILKEALKNNIIEIANHGLTHCIVGKQMPRLFTSNREFHREFYAYLPEELIKDHLDKSQKILEDYFGQKIVTFVPPGHVCSKYSENYAKKIGLVNISTKEENSFAFHDREISLYGIPWLVSKINNYKNNGYEIVKVKDLS